MGIGGIHSALAVSVAACAIAIAGPAQAQSRSFNVPSQPASSGIPEFARQADIQILVSEGAVRGKTTRAVRGTMPINRALALLLNGTGLRVASSDGRTFTLALGRPVSNADLDGQGPEVVGSASADTDNDTENAGIVITGTRIRGIRNDTAPVVRIDRRQIEDSGFSTAQELFESLPQTFGGGAAGASEDGLLGEGSQRVTNFTSASGINLRGLGSNSTLVLLNGRRMAPSQFGQTVDISLLPLGAIGGVDLLTDGSSALYGSDAIAGVVNIRLRSDFDGFETGVRFGTSIDGGRTERTVSQLIGRDWGSGSLFVSGQYQNFDPLHSDQRAFTRNRPMPTDVLPDTRTYSGILVLEQAVSNGARVFAQASYSDKDVFRDNRNGNIQEANASTVRNLGLTVGGTIDLPADWRASVSLLYGRDRGWGLQEQVNLFSLATTVLAQRNTYESRGADLVLDGTLFDLPAGSVRAAFGASYRDDEFDQVASINGIAQPDRFAGAEVSALFGELYVPLVGPDMAVPAIRRLDLSVALRYDSYDVFGGTTNPRVGLIYEPFESFRVRASYSRSFRAPNISEQLIGAFSTSVLGYPFANPDGAGTVPAFYVSGSLDVGPEKAESFTWGFDWEPRFLPGFTLTFNHYDIAFKDRILYPNFDTDALRLPLVYGDLIGTFADDAAAQTFLDEIVASGGAFLDFNGGGATGVRYFYDGRQLNASRVDQSGFDITASQRVEIGENALTLRLNASYISEIDTRLIAGAASVDFVDTYGNPVDLRLRGDLNWSNDRLSLNAGVNYVDGYEDTTQLTDYPVSSWTTVDLSARFRIGDFMGRPREKVQLALSVQNVFDQDPPFIIAHNATAVNYDPANASPLGRFVAAELRIGW